MTEFRFPDEKKTPAPAEDKIEFEIEGEAAPEIEVVDDTPEQDRGRAPMKEPPTDVTDEELEKYSESVRNRIKHFSRGYHDERRAKEAALREREEALRLAQNLVEENKKLQGSLGQGQQALLEQAKKVVSSEVEEAKRKLKEAHESFDTDAIIAAQEELTAAKIKAERVHSFKPPSLQPAEDVVQPAPTQEERPTLDPKTRAWTERNPWFGKDRRMTAFSLALHQELVDRGMAIASDEYFQSVDAEMRKTFPDAFPSEKEPQRKPSVVAPATRSTAPKKIVLTQSAINIAKRLGLTPEQYAREVARLERTDNG